MEPDAVEVEVTVDASPETVFSFFTDPDKVGRWHGVEAFLDPRPGGIFRLNVTGRDVTSGEFVEVVPGRKVVFTWGWEDPDSPVPPGSSTVEVTFVPDAARTIVRVRHLGLPSGTAVRQHAVGWRHYLDRLSAAVTGADPGADPWAKEPSKLE